MSSFGTAIVSQAMVETLYAANFAGWTGGPAKISTANHTSTTLSVLLDDTFRSAAIGLKPSSVASTSTKRR